MYSQKNVLQVFVSPLNAQQAKVGVALADLPLNEIAFFLAATDVSAASGDGYFAFNDAGVIKKSNPVSFAGWDVQSYAASTAHTETITVPTLVVGKDYILGVKVLTENFNGDETAKANRVAVTGDTPTTMAAALVAQLVAKIAREGGTQNFTITSSGATITITAKKYPFVLGRRLGGYAKFKSNLFVEDGTSLNGTVTVAGTNGVGEGFYIQTKEFFARKNSDAVSHNEFRTGFPTPDLNSTEAGEYDVQAVSGVWVEGGLSDNIKALPRQILIAFDSNGSAPSVIA